MLKKCVQLVLAIVCTGLLLPINSVSATTGPRYTTTVDTTYFEDFTADYYLYRDEKGVSRMEVVEQLTAVFPKTGQNHGITRVIPYTNNDGKNLTMTSDNTIYMDVERNGKEEPVSKVEVGDGFFHIYIGDADKYVTGEQEYTLYYDFLNVTLDHVDENGKKFQELYWDSNGNDWSQRFNSVTARVHLDQEIADKFTGETSCYVGRYGESGQNRCTIEILDETAELNDEHTSDVVVEFSSIGKLSARENLTFVLEFEDGTFAPAKSSFDFLLVFALIILTLGAIALIVLIGLALASTSEKRKYYKEKFVKPEYTPMPDITVAEMATNYIGKGASGDMRVATLIDLAVNHKIEMIKSEADGAFGKKKTVWKVKIKTDRLNKQQATILKILAGSDTPLKLNQVITVKSHTANSELTKLATSFTETITKSLEKKGLMVKTKKSSSKSATDSAEKSSTKTHNYPSWLAIASVIYFFLALFIFIFTVDYEPSYGELVGEGFLSIVMFMMMFIMVTAGSIVAAKTSKYAERTIAGLDASKYLEGLKLYMGMAEAERLKLLQSVKGADTTNEGVVKIYEKLLPYAVIFKMEKSWLDELSHYYELEDVAAPIWYVGVGAFSAREFSSAMMSAGSSISSNISHSTISNSSSGFSGGGGGGFSGGGGGGGGGGTW